MEWIGPSAIFLGLALLQIGVRKGNDAAAITGLFLVIIGIVAIGTLWLIS